MGNCCTHIHSAHSSQSETAAILSLLYDEMIACIEINESALFTLRYFYLLNYA
jgi:hypothetical protein